MTFRFQSLCGLSLTVLLFFACISASAQTDDSSGWTPIAGNAADISINGDGQAYAVGFDGIPWRWDRVEQRWRRMSGKFIRITAAEDNRPWAIDEEGTVFRYNGLWWENKDTDVVDVAADRTGTVFIAKTDGTVQQWYPARSEWRPLAALADGSAWRIALDRDGLPWIVTKSGAIRSFDGRAWSVRAGRAKDIAIGGANTVAIADGEGLVRVFDRVQRRWTVVAGASNIVTVAVTPDDGTWAVTQTGAILATRLLISEIEEAQENQAPGAKALDITAPINTAPPVSAPVATAPPVTVPASQAPLVSVPSITASAVDAPSVVPETPTPPRPERNDNSVPVIDAASVTTQDAIRFTNTRKNATSLAIGKDGSVFALDTNGGVLRWSNARRTFEEFPGTLVRIAVDPEGNPWGVSALGRVFRHTGSVWRQIAGATASDIAIGASGAVIIADARGALSKLNEGQTRFDRITGNGTVIAVDPDDTPWTIRTDRLVQRCDTSPCTILQQKAKSIGIGPDGSVWIVSDRDLLMRLKDDGKTFGLVQAPGFVPTKVAVGPNGFPWIVSDAQLVFASNFFDRDESGDRIIAASTVDNTQGTGETSAVTSTTSFTFSKNMRFETVNTDFFSSGVTIKIESGIDGVIYGAQSDVIGAFNAKRNAFTEERTGLSGNDYSIRDFGVASNGDIWAYIMTYYQELKLFRDRNGSLKEYTVNNLLIDGLAVAPDDTVYAIFNIDSSNDYSLYTKAPNSETFKKFSNDNSILDVSVGPGNDIWIVDRSNIVYQWTGDKFVKRPQSGQKARRISVGLDGTVYISDNDSNRTLRKWNAANQSFDAVNNISAQSFTVDENGRPWVLVDSPSTVKRARD